MCAAAQTPGEPAYVAFAPVRGGVPLVEAGQATPVLVSAGDWPGVQRAAGDLCADVKRVTGVQPRLLQQAAASRGADAVIVGTLGHSALIDDLVRRHRLEVQGIAGHWEMALTTVVEHPLPGVRRALVIAGADKRGTIYGIYDLSAQMGVSPWTWWADVAVPHHDVVFVEAGRHVQPEPAVKYRGIFFNDEAPALSGWAHETFGNLNSRFYTRVFELLLRLKANYLWPAMWNNAFATDDPKNPELADEYGIVMGTSHEEPMMRAEKEWDWGHYGKWDYTTNAAEIDDFWRKGMQRDRNYEEIVTMGMRGHNDTPMSATESTALLEKIVADQRQILRETVNPDLRKVPQVWALYKEVQGYYDRGMRVPDDVTLLWSDDNWGNLRRLPTAEERRRSGGAGIYYHFDYVGGPRSYKWLNTYSISKVQEQMHLALQYGADRIWVVNVGDGKPMEFPISFFLDYARTPDRWPADKLHAYTVAWATQQFGPEHAEAIAECLEEYTLLNSLRKPEMLEPDTFSQTHFDEAARVAASWQRLIERVEALEAALPSAQQASFFELVGYPAKASGNVALMEMAAGRNALEARLGRPEANADKAEVERRFALDAAYTDQYNHTLMNGKWDHMMDQTHIGYTFWNEPPANAMPPVTEIQPSGKVLAHTGPPVAAAPLRSDGVPVPAGFQGFVERDGYVAMEAAETTARATGDGTLRWAELPGFYESVPHAPAAEGLRAAAALTVTPANGASELTSSAGLSYSVFLNAHGSYMLHLRVAPTLNFVPGRGLRLAVSVDDGARTVVDLLADNSQAAWAEAVSDGARNVSVPLPIEHAGAHVLHVWAVDPAVVLERLVIAQEPLPSSYLGPPASARTGVAAAPGS